MDITTALFGLIVVCICSACFFEWVDKAYPEPLVCEQVVELTP